MGGKFKYYRLYPYKSRFETERQKNEEGRGWILLLPPFLPLPPKPIQVYSFSFIRIYDLIFTFFVNICNYCNANL